MTEFPPPTPPAAGSPDPSTWTTTPAADSTPARLPFSKWTIYGFVLACISLVVFGFLGAIGVILSARGFRDSRRGIVRGRGLAIAGIIIGFLGFVFYAIGVIMRLH
jgi:amino acid transporter